MKKDMLWRIVLILLPVAALGLEAMPDSVSVMLETGAVTTSFFGTLPDGSLPMGMAFAGLMTGVTVVLAAIYAGTRKGFWLGGVLWISLLAATLSVLPLLLRTEPLVLPNVGVTLLLCVEALLCWLQKKQLNVRTDLPSGKRLG